MTDYPASTVNELLAQTAAGAPAIGAPGRPWMTHAGLRAQMQQTVDALNAIGIGRNDRVAIVLPNGPEMACAFIAIAAGATTAPLNPAYRTEEFAFYLADLSAKALVIGEGMESPARAVAEATNIPIVELIAGDGAAGTFTLRAPDSMRGAPSRTGLAEADDVALVLHTSGTTSRPKIVPLRHVNIIASATHIRNTLRLTADDVCLNIMPLFHIHGLIAATLSSLGAGASVFCSFRLHCVPLLHLVPGSQPHLVDRRPYHAPDHSRPRRAARRDHPQGSPPLHSFPLPPPCRRR